MLKDFELILKELNKGFERKDLEIMMVKFDLERAKEEADEYAKKCEELEQKVGELEAKCREVQDATCELMKLREKQHKEEVELLESRIIYLEGKLKPIEPVRSAIYVDDISYEMEKEDEIRRREEIASEMEGAE